MMRLSSRALKMAVLPCVLALFMSACAGQQRTAPQPDQQRMEQQGRNMQGDFTPGVNPPQDRSILPGTDADLDRRAPQTQQMVDYRQKSNNVRNQVAAMGEVEKANVVVVGNTCLVGYKPSRLSKDVNATKKMISERVKQTDRSIDNVVVSESADVMDRVNRLYNDIANNRPMNEVNNEFKQLVNRVAPAAK